MSLWGRARAALDAFVHPPAQMYGRDKTIHQTGHVDVEISPAGHVVAVWFRCMTLPFEEHFVDIRRAVAMVQMAEHSPPNMLVAIEVDPERVDHGRPKTQENVWHKSGVPHNCTWTCPGNPNFGVKPPKDPLDLPLRPSLPLFEPVHGVRDIKFTC